MTYYGAPMSLPTPVLRNIRGSSDVMRFRARVLGLLYEVYTLYPMTYFGLLTDLHGFHTISHGTWRGAAQQGQDLRPLKAWLSALT